MYLLALIFILLLVVLASVIAYVRLIDVHHETVHYPITLFDTSDVPLIKPPGKIVIEGNAHECHRTLTPCTTHADCNACREGLANCQLFDEDTVVQMHDVDGNEQTVTIRAGESYCFALDRERARSCNPSTGVWLLAETQTGFALLCSCLRPGLVTQLNMYEDCNVPVGCAPHGHITDVDGGDLRCVCDEGYISDFDAATETPFCRPRTVRDVLFDESFFPRAPCADGQVRLDHPGLNDYYRRYFRIEDICVVDPCSVDPISGRRTSGRLFSHTTADGEEINGCNCSAADGLLPVFNRHIADSGMVRRGDRTVANACLQPFNVHMLALKHVDYKYFWGRADHNNIADADIVFQANAAQLSDERYRVMLYPLLTPHPDVTEITLAGTGVLKISVSYDTVLKSTLLPASLFRLFKWKEGGTSEPVCFFPGAGRCIVINSDACIRRHGNAQVWTAETFTNSWCIFSRDGANIKIWSRAGRYPHGDAPAVLRLRGFFLNNDRERNTLRVVSTGAMTSGAQIDALTQTLETYPNYSV
ncbi:occlusion-derived virus envelope protein [Condylorrhiza vestigialis mutiple nucleopolyhedrovirus]|uniref:Occlusion-derived virus envelope protein n=1 Tax=Condylorrhiza vestigialis mutiple nucleopolyhedrovirus TaxID=1592576 RepID=A0A0B4ULZ3_9ABAC|nr:occlusion-derived virus envelope protein [Condylorrhiza vestigialis mutiple nucleopolyhedrovirus]AJD09198.1 occlusion-derived virus envelope protein [Condylorrhiza vestigialis mutiple nucleopolyhedrovirus]